MNLNLDSLNLNDYGPLILRDLVGTLPADDTTPDGWAFVGGPTDVTPDATQCPNCGQSLEWCDCAGEWGYGTSLDAAVHLSHIPRD